MLKARLTSEISLSSVNRNDGHSRARRCSPNKLIYGMHLKFGQLTALLCRSRRVFTVVTIPRWKEFRIKRNLIKTFLQKEKLSAVWSRTLTRDRERMDESTFLPIFVTLREAGSTTNSPRLPLFTAITRLFVTLLPSSSAMSRVNVKLKMATTLPRLQKKTERPRQLTQNYLQRVIAEITYNLRNKTCKKLQFWRKLLPNWRLLP